MRVSLGRIAVQILCILMFSCIVRAEGTDRLSWEEQWDEIVEISGGVFRVCIEDDYGIVSKDGRILIAPEWDMINNAQYSIDFEDKYNTPIGQNFEDLFLVWKDGKVGCMFAEKDIVVTSAQWDSISIFTSTYAIVRKDNKYGAISIEIDTEDMYLARGIVLEPIYKWIDIGCDCLFYAKDQNDKYGVMYSDGTILTPFIWDVVFEFDGRYAEVSMGKKRGLINRNGDVVLEAKWDAIRYIDDRYILVELNEDYWVFDCEEGTFLSNIPFKLGDYSPAHEFWLGDPFPVMNSLVGYCSIDGDMVISPRFMDASQFCNNGYAEVVLNDGKWALINRNGDIVYSFEESVYVFDYITNDYYVVLNESNGKSGIIHVIQGEILPTIWDSIRLTASGNFYAVKNKQGYLFSKNGDQIGSWKTN